MDSERIVSLVRKALIHAVHHFMFDSVGDAAVGSRWQQPKAESGRQPISMLQGECNAYVNAIYVLSCSQYDCGKLYRATCDTDGAIIPTTGSQ